MQYSQGSNQYQSLIVSLVNSIFLKKNNCVKLLTNDQLILRNILFKQRFMPFYRFLGVYSVTAAFKFFIKILSILHTVSIHSNDVCKL